MMDESANHDPDGWILSGVEAMVGATLALMTGHAQAKCPTRRRLMALKVRSHLMFLSGHPDLSPNLRQVAAQVAAHWDPLCRCAEPVASAAIVQPTAHWAPDPMSSCDADTRIPANRTIH